MVQIIANIITRCSIILSTLWYKDIILIINHSSHYTMMGNEDNEQQNEIIKDIVKNILLEEKKLK